MNDPVIVPVEYSHVAHVADYARKADRDEIAASSGRDMREILCKSVRISTACWAMTIKGEPVVIAGVAPLNVLQGEGVPWAIGTDGVTDNPMLFMKASKTCMAEIIRYYSYLTNYVDARNEAAIRYLKHIGFEFHEAEPYGISGLPFHKFEMRA